MIFAAPGSFSYFLVKTLVVVCLFSYAVIGLYSESLPENELYPFFSWFLFTRVPPRVQTEPSIQFVSIQDQPLDPPVVYFQPEARSILTFDKFLPTEYQNFTQLLYAAFQRGDKLEVERFRKFIEAGIVSQDVGYKLVMIRFDILERVKTGKFEVISDIASFRQNRYE